jgi:hypothetical protein
MPAVLLRLLLLLHLMRMLALAARPVFAGGMLLYMTLITFIGEEFTRSDLHTPQLRGLKYQMWALLVCGAAAMALLGIWA